jgi:predicted metalloprotease
LINRKLRPTSSAAVAAGASAAVAAAGASAAVAAGVACVAGEAVVVVAAVVVAGVAVGAELRRVLGISTNVEIRVWLDNPRSATHEKKTGRQRKEK